LKIIDQEKSNDFNSLLKGMPNSYYIVMISSE